MTTGRAVLRRKDLVEPDLSYQIVGAVLDVFHELGAGLKEATYQRAVREALKRRGLQFREQVCYPIMYQGKRVGSRYLDFLVADRVILELKRGEYFSRANITQVREYLVLSSHHLAIIANITERGVHFRRIVHTS